MKLGSWDYPQDALYHPEWVPLQVPQDLPTAPLFGVELEVERTPTTINRLVQVHTPEWGVYKYEAATHNGAEFVSPPFTFSWYLARGAEQFRALLEGWKRSNLAANLLGGEGMHVHVSRTAFADAKHLYRFLRLFYGFPAFTTRLSGRDAFQLSRWAEVHISLKGLLQSLVRCHGQLMLRTRYCAINLEHRQSVEVRFFANTLDFGQFDSNLRLVEAAVEFTRTSQSVRGIAPKIFLSWLADRLPADSPVICRVAQALA